VVIEKELRPLLSLVTYYFSPGNDLEPDELDADDAFSSSGNFQILISYGGG
jgi:hypothetical protein